MATAKKAVTRKTAAKKKAAAKKAPWDQDNPKARSGETTQHLSDSAKESAKKAAKKAGRPYPNLVDNMRAAAKSGKRRGE